MNPADRESAHPETFCLPRSGKRDPYFNCSRSWYYQAEKQGLIHLVRIKGRGKLRGITRVSYDEMRVLTTHPKMDDSSGTDA